MLEHQSQFLTPPQQLQQQEQQPPSAQQAITVDVAGDTTVEELKGILVERTGVPRDRQGLVFRGKGKVLEDAQTMAHYNIGREDTIEMSVRSVCVGGVRHGAVRGRK